jgi:hypothetical protein
LVELTDKSVKDLQQARMIRELKAASDRRQKALEAAEQRMLDALNSADATTSNTTSNGNGNGNGKGKNETMEWA